MKECFSIAIRCPCKMWEMFRTNTITNASTHTKLGFGVAFVLASSARANIPCTASAFLQCYVGLHGSSNVGGCCWPGATPAAAGFIFSFTDTNRYMQPSELLLRRCAAGLRAAQSLRRQLPLALPCSTRNKLLLGAGPPLRSNARQSENRLNKRWSLAVCVVYEHVVEARYPSIRASPMPVQYYHAHETEVVVIKNKALVST